MQHRTRDGHNGAVTLLHVDCKPHDVIRNSAGLGSEIYVEMFTHQISLLGLMKIAGVWKLGEHWNRRLVTCEVKCFIYWLWAYL
jgi:hypothetical protein